MIFQTLLTGFPVGDKTKSSHPIYLRTAINSDFKSILNIDLKSFDPEWSIEKFESHRESTRVAIVQDRVVGFWVACLEISINYENITLLRLAVTPSFRRQGIGAALMEDMLTNYNHLMCATILIDTQKEGQLFLVSQGFRCIKTLRKVNIPGIGEITSYFFKRKSGEHTCFDKT